MSTLTEATSLSSISRRHMNTRYSQYIIYNHHYTLLQNRQLTVSYDQPSGKLADSTWLSWGLYDVTMSGWGVFQEGTRQSQFSKWQKHIFPKMATFKVNEYILMAIGDYKALDLIHHLKRKELAVVLAQLRSWPWWRNILSPIHALMCCGGLPYICSYENIHPHKLMARVISICEHSILFRKSASGSISA